MHVYLRGSAEQKLRLASGLILFAFAGTHFLNHALGLVSLEIMHDAQVMRTAITRSLAGSLVLGAALMIHISLALLKTARRRTWRMPPWEAVQILLGFTIPFFLFPHIINTRVAHQVFDVQDSYLYELVRLWPDSAIVQTLLLLTVWGHGCLGLHYWLRLSDAYKRSAPWLLMFAIAVPLLAFAGFAVAGQSAGDIMSDQEALASLKSRSNWPNAADTTTLAWLRLMARVSFYSLVAVVIVIVVCRQFSRKVFSSPLRVHFVDGPTMDVVPGKTLLELSRAAGISHASVCGGRGRCSTCRVRIEKGLRQLPPPSGAEAITLAAICAPSNIRLACQVRPASDLSVALVSKPDVVNPPQESFPGIKDFVSAHVRGIVGAELIDITSRDIGDIRQWLEANGHDVGPVRDLDAHGFTMCGARLEYIEDIPRAAIIYLHGDHIISMFPSRADAGLALVMSGQHGGYRVRTHSSGEQSFVLVSDLPFEVLKLLEVALRPTAPELKAGIEAAIQ